MVKLSALSLFAAAMFAQTVAPTLTTNSVAAGKNYTLSVNFSAGATPAAGLQWTMALPTGVTATWTVAGVDTADGKSLSCTTSNTGSQTCIVVGLNTTTITTGIVATAALTFAPTLRGAQTFTISSPLSASATGSALTTTGSAITVTVLSPYDLNGDGVVNNADLLIAIGQALGMSPCTTADFNGDGVCNIQDLVLLAVDSASTTP